VYIRLDDVSGSCISVNSIHSTRAFKSAESSLDDSVFGFVIVWLHVGNSPEQMFKEDFIIDRMFSSSYVPHF